VADCERAAPRESAAGRHFLFCSRLFLKQPSGNLTLVIGPGSGPAELPLRVLQTPPNADARSALPPAVGD
jgi:hypothetical protein